MINKASRTTEGWCKLCFGHDDLYEAIECQETFVSSMERPAMKEVRDEMTIQVRLVKQTTNVAFEVIEDPQMVKDQ